MVVVDVAALLGVGEEGLDAAAGVVELADVRVEVADAGQLGFGPGAEGEETVHCFLDQLLGELVRHGCGFFFGFGIETRS